MAQQLGFDLPVRVALGRDDFLVAPSNAVALSMVDGWRSWPLGKLVLTGPAGSGKTHLAHVWAAESGAQIIAADALDAAAPEALFDGPLAVEDVDRIAQNIECQTALFHIHNALQAAGHPLLMTGEHAPNLWRLSLPDLQSRVDAAGHAALDAPDDSLLAAVLAKLFADRQLTPRPDVIPYLVTHMERSFAAARTVVAAIDARSLAQKKPITRALAAACLDNPR
ncbi:MULTISPECIES: DnaA ATPase domain-containing protein [Roseobacteraceae]|uniref:DnaA ATPase domain-containing protein n=1 Tax=Roseobacteraceae TaxID=2854170 RepID=UPI001C47ABD7|nr:MULTISPECIES: DnaA/Hda family protein [Roseobacteraceae]MBV7408920.1 chromosomal replication initiator DnaA [Maritimibacter sp. DP1N21-5]MBY5934393.1 chromosomal replication initiator DnaA [Tateyamaria omphalii]